MLSRDEMQKAMRGPIKIVDVPEWGGEVGIRRMSAAELVDLRRFSVEEEARTSDSDLTAVCEMLARCLCDANGRPIFAPPELRDWDGQQVALLNRLLIAAQEHNGMGAGAAEEREKNSASGQTSDST